VKRRRIDPRSRPLDARRFSSRPTQAAVRACSWCLSLDNCPWPAAA
jgi:hypothetical protein